MAGARQYTTEEVREKFLEQAREIAQYWGTLKGKSDIERCKGAVFSVLALLDGSNVGLPGFVVAPRPHKDDEAYLKAKGENWFPRAESDYDIAGELHELFHK